MFEDSQQAAANPQTRPTTWSCDSACRLLSSTSTITICYYYSSGKLILILLSHGGWKAESRSPRGCSKGVQPVSRATYQRSCRDRSGMSFWDSSLPLYSVTCLDCRKLGHPSSSRTVIFHSCPRNGNLSVSQLIIFRNFQTGEGG